MKKVTKFLKNNKLLVLLAILIILFLLFCLKLVLAFTESDEDVFYGNRLEGIEKVEINKDNLTKKLSEKLKDHAESVSVRTQGRIINIVISLKDEVSRDDGKEDAKKSLEEFSDNEKKYYDFQIFLKKSDKAENSKQFPVVGYKHHVRDEIRWTKDRTGE